MVSDFWNPFSTSANPFFPAQGYNSSTKGFQKFRKTTKKHLKLKIRASETSRRDDTNNFSKPYRCQN